MKSSTGAEIKENNLDEFQERYLAHQVLPGGKKDELIQIMKERHSNRRYDSKDLPQDLIDKVLDACRYAPSSCDRFGVRIKVITERDDKALLNGLLVGGVGWIYRAPAVLMLWADRDAYKGGDNGDEVNYNAYIDAGVLVQTLMLSATSLDLHTAYCNPQVRVRDRDYFNTRFAPSESSLFCGAVALGYPHPEPITKERRLIESVVL